MAQHSFPDRAVTCAARSGFLTKELWSRFMFAGKTVRGTNKAWARLVERRYFVPHANRRLKNVLVLNRGNRALMSELGKNVVRTPHEGLLLHDETLLSGILQIERGGVLEHWMTESQLKSSGMELFRVDSQGQEIKYPDAVLYVNSSGLSATVAIEIELTQKDRKRYRQILSAYSFMPELAGILFVISEPVIESAIRRAAEQTLLDADLAKIGFMTLTDWKRDPVDSDVRFINRKTRFVPWAQRSDSKSIC